MLFMLFMLLLLLWESWVRGGGGWSGSGGGGLVGTWVGGLVRGGWESGGCGGRSGVAWDGGNGAGIAGGLHLLLQLLLLFRSSLIGKVFMLVWVKCWFVFGDYRYTWYGFFTCIESLTKIPVYK